MTHPRTTPQAAKPGLSRLRPVVSCAVRAAAFLLCFALSALMVFAPFDVKLDSGSGFHIESSKAHAVAPYVAGASDFLSAAAAGAGLTESEFVATVAGVATTGYGMSFATSAGINYGQSLGQNLSSLVDAADYPAWESLDNSTKEAWGTKEYYETSKFNSLCDAFGLGDARQRFHTAGGGNVDFTNDEIGILNHIGNIGDTWINRTGAAFEDIKSLFNQDSNEILAGFFGAPFGEYTADDSNTNWPLPFRTFKVGYGNWLKFRPSNSSYYTNYATSSDCYWVIMSPTNNVSYNVYIFSKTPFNAGVKDGEEVPTNLNNSSIVKTLDGNTYYVYSYARGGSWPGIEQMFNMPVNIYSNSNWTDNQMYQALGYMLYDGVELNEPSPIEDYPGQSEIPNDEEIYYPDDGIVPSNVWNTYITQPSNPNPDPENPPVVERPDNPFNPDDQSGTEKWKQDTSANIQGLGRVHFEKLFPFSLYHDLSLFWDKVQVMAGIGQGENGLNTQASSQYETVELRFYIPDVMDDEWTFDLSSLHDLLLITKPFFLVFLIGIEIISLIFFWKGILTGS